MDRTRFARLMLTAAGVVAALGGLLVVLLVINAPQGFAGATVSARLGWTIPLLSGAVLGGVAWMLLSAGGGHEGPNGPLSRNVVCGSCSKPVLEDWRLCPHCGVRLDREPRRDAEPLSGGTETRRARF